MHPVQHMEFASRIDHEGHVDGAPKPIGIHVPAGLCDQVHDHRAEFPILLEKFIEILDVPVAPALEGPRIVGNTHVTQIVETI